MHLSTQLWLWPWPISASLFAQPLAYLHAHTKRSKIADLVARKDTEKNQEKPTHTFAKLTCLDKMHRQSRGVAAVPAASAATAESKEYVALPDLIFLRLRNVALECSQRRSCNTANANPNSSVFSSIALKDETATQLMQIPTPACSLQSLKSEAAKQLMKIPAPARPLRMLSEVKLPQMAPQPRCYASACELGS